MIVFDHHAAGLDELAFDCCEGHADGHVASGTVSTPARTAAVAGDHAADGGGLAVGGVYRDELVILVKDAV